MSEVNAAKGYIALKKQVDANTPATPTVYCPYYSQGVTTDPHFMSDEPIYGRRFKRLQTLQAIRSHGGQVVVMAEPDSAPLWHDMTMAQVGSDATNNPIFRYDFGESITVDPIYYTMDISYGSYVERFWGVGAEKITYGWNGEKMQYTLDTAGLGSFNGREVASISTTAVTLKTDYDPAPTKGLVVNDLVKIIKADGTTTNFTVSAVTSDTVVTLSATAAAFAAGDMLVLRPASPTLSFKTPFLWPRTQFYFAADAATALTNSSTTTNQQRLDVGTEISIMNSFDNAEGTKRSGAFDPASLPRTVYDAEIKIKTFLDNPEKIKDWNALRKKAMIMRCFSGTGYEMRVTVNNMVALTNDHPTESMAIIYHEFAYQPNFDTTDNQAFGVSIFTPRTTL
jgi:hypothetical protein